MRAIFTSDIHIHPYKIGSRDGGMDRLRDGIAVLRQSLELAQRRKCAWIFCGDLKMPKTVWPQEALNSTLHTFEAFPDVPKLMIPGNHDGLHGHWGSGLAPFRHLARVIDQPQFIDFEGMTFACWPFGLHRPAGYSDFLKSRSAKDVTLLAHAFVQGVALGPVDVHLPDKGIPPRDLLGPFKLAVLGDIHKGQWWHDEAGWRWSSYADGAKLLMTEDAGDVIQLRRGGGRPWHGEICYPGSPYQQSWGEVSDWPKGVLEIDFTVNRIWFHPLKSPRFRTIDLRGDRLSYLKALADKTGIWDDDFVKILLGPVHQGKEAEAYLTRIREISGARSVSVIPSRPAPATRKVQLHAAMTQSELFKRYVEARPLDGVDGKTVLHAGLSLAKEEDD